MRGPGHFGSGEVLAKGRHEQMPQPSENVRQSESVLQAVDVPGSAFGGGEGDGGVPGSVFAPVGVGGVAGIACTGCRLGVEEASGPWLRSPRTHARAKLENSASAMADRRAILQIPVE